MLNNQTSVQNSAQNVLNNDPSKQEQMMSCLLFSASIWYTDAYAQIHPMR